MAEKSNLQTIDYLVPKSNFFLLPFDILSCVFGMCKSLHLDKMIIKIAKCPEDIIRLRLERSTWPIAARLQNVIIILRKQAFLFEARLTKLQDCRFYQMSRHLLNQITHYAFNKCNH